MSVSSTALDQRNEIYELDSWQELRADLNPAFLVDRSIAPIDVRDGVLTVGMIDVDDLPAISALAFATGLKIAPTQMPQRDISLRLASFADMPAPASAAPVLSLPSRGGTAVTTGGEPTPGVEQTAARASLAEGIGDWLASRPRAETPLAWLIRLLGAGYTPVEAGTIIIQAHGRGDSRLNPADLAAAQLLKEGANLEAALSAPGVPAWFKTALACAHEGVDRLQILTGLSECEASMAARRGKARILFVELAVWAVPALIAWSAISLSAGALIVAAVVAAGAIARPVIVERPENDAVRAAVLEVVAAIARLGVLESAAVRVGLARLQALVPTWGYLPEGRDGLASALSLPPLTEALLQRGDLAAAAARTAHQCGERADKLIVRTRGLVRYSGMLLVGTAAALLLL